MKGKGSLGRSFNWHLALPALLLLAACGGGGAAAGQTRSDTADPTVSPGSGSLTPDPRAGPIIQGYIDATKAFVHAASTQNPNDPAIAGTTYGAELFTVSKNLGIDAGLGIVGRGDIQPGDPHVISIAGSSAVLRDCRYSTLHMYSAKTGQPVQGVAGGATGENEGVTATLSFVENVWKVSAEDVKAGSCPPGF